MRLWKQSYRLFGISWNNSRKAYRKQKGIFELLQDMSAKYDADTSKNVSESLYLLIRFTMWAIRVLMAKEKVT